MCNEIQSPNALNQTSCVREMKFQLTTFEVYFVSIFFVQNSIVGQQIPKRLGNLHTEQIHEK